VGVPRAAEAASAATMDSSAIVEVEVALNRLRKGSHGHRHIRGDLVDDHANCCWPDSLTFVASASPKMLRRTQLWRSRGESVVRVLLWRRWEHIPEAIHMSCHGGLLELALQCQAREVSKKMISGFTPGRTGNSSDVSAALTDPRRDTN